MTKNTSRIIRGLGIATLIFVGCSPQGSSARVRYRETRLLLGTVVHLDVCYEPSQEAGKEAAYRKAWERLEEIDLRMNVYNPESDMAKIHQGYPAAVTVNPDTWGVIREAGDIHRLTGGAFDITVGPLVALWKQAGRENRLPTPAEVEAVRRDVGFGNIELLASLQVRIIGPGVRVDLGGIAKGYAVDEIARIFRENGLENFYIDAGGNIYVGGLNCEGVLWRIGIRDPLNRERVSEVVSMSNASVATSGSYEQHFDIGGRRWSHIVNPLSGYPLESHEGGWPVASATVIAPQGSWADGLATALNLLPPDQGLALVDRLGDGYAASIMWWDPRQGRYVTSATDRFQSHLVPPKNP